MPFIYYTFWKSGKPYIIQEKKYLLISFIDKIQKVLKSVKDKNYDK